MATLDQLKDTLRDALTDQGMLQKMRAEMRAEVFKLLHEPDEGKPSLPHEVVVVNELIMEYLEYQKWHNTMSVMGPESGYTQRIADSHKVMCSELHR